MSPPTAGRRSMMLACMAVSSLLDDHAAKDRSCGQLAISTCADRDQNRCGWPRLRRAAFSRSVNRNTHAREPYALSAIGALDALRIFVVHPAHKAEGDQDDQ